MERVKILELRAGYEKKHKRRLLYDEIATAVFKGDKGAPSPARQRALIARWNKGHDLATFTFCREFRLAALFGVSSIHDIKAI